MSEKVALGILFLVAAVVAVGSYMVISDAGGGGAVYADGVSVPRQIYSPAEVQLVPQSTPLAAPAVGVPMAVPMATPLSVPTAAAVREVIENVYAPSFEEQQEYAPDYSAYVDPPLVFTEERSVNHYEGKTFTTSNDTVLTLEDAEFLLACVDGKAVGRRVSPKCPIKGRETEGNPMGLSVAELLGQGR